MNEHWPALPYDEWKDTLDTLHMWMQVVGKTKMVLAPFLNEWWEVTFAVTARGITTSTIPCGRRVFEANFDFIDHKLDVNVSDGSSHTIHLGPRSVADFYQEFMGALADLRIEVKITTNPVEVENTIPFDEDREHASYDPEYVNRFWRILLQVDRVLQRYRTPFVGKSSDVQFWWGSFDLAETRFSGRPAPKRDWPAHWMELGADQESSLAGFWPGNSKLPAPTFVAYTYPEPPGCRTTAIQPDHAYFHPDLGEFVLPYDAVRNSPFPEDTLLHFFNSAYETGATLAGWDRSALERPELLKEPRGART